MIPLLFSLVLAEMVVIVVLLFKTPLRKLLVMGLNKAKQGRGPVMAKTVAGTLSVVFLSSFYSIIKIQKRAMDSSAVNPTDQVLLANHILEASLMGFSLFLALMIDRLHYYVKELRMLRKSLKKARHEHKGTKEQDVKPHQAASRQIKQRPGGATALEGNSAATDTPSSAENVGKR